MMVQVKVEFYKFNAIIPILPSKDQKMKVSGSKLFIQGIPLISFLFCNVNANDFPSLLVANATVGKQRIININYLCLTFHLFSAILLDHEYLDNEYVTTLEKVKIIIEKVLREDLKDGGLVIKYYSWTEINFNKGKFNIINLIQYY